MSKVITIDREDILSEVKLSCKLPETIEQIVKQKVIENTTSELGITVGTEELQTAADKFRLMYELGSADRTWTWLQKHHLSLDDFEQIVYNHALSTKLAIHLFADKIEPYFFEHQLDYVSVVMYEVILEDENLAMELFYAIKEREMSFYDVAHKYIQDKELRRKGGYKGIINRRDLKPEISATIFSSQPPQVIKPIITSKGVHLILVEEIIQPELNNFLRNTIAISLFSEWLKQQLEQFEVRKDF